MSGWSTEELIEFVRSGEGPLGPQNYVRIYVAQELVKEIDRLLGLVKDMQAQLDYVAAEKQARSWYE